jgi:Family of unknown function (DUF6221)
VSDREDIVPFLRARYDEDEDAARGLRSGAWRVEDGAVLDESGVVVRLEAGADAVAAHIARHDPASVVRGLAVRRALFDVHNTSPIDDTAWFLLRVMASEYRRHDDFRAEWAVIG